MTDRQTPSNVESLPPPEPGRRVLIKGQQTKAVIIDAPAPQVAVSRANTTITVKPGAKTLLGGGNGRTIELEAEILDVSK